MAASSSAAEPTTTVKLMYKTMRGPPTVKRGCGDTLNDLGRAFDHEVAHSELLFSDGYTFLASLDRGVFTKARLAYDHFDREGHWKCHELYLPRSEAQNVRRFCNEHLGDDYDLSGILLGMIPGLRSMRKEKEHAFTCTTLCMRALLRSDTFRRCVQIVEPHFFDHTGAPVGAKRFDSHPQHLYNLMSAICADTRTRSTCMQAEVPLKIRCASEEERQALIASIVDADTSDSDRDSSDGELAEAGADF